jgi:uncharacterized membrane protein YgdD (TMEM256/DUF423 family)
MINPWFRVASALMLLGVVLGAFGAHGLKSRLSPESLQIWQTAVLYHFIHAGALFVCSWALTQGHARAGNAAIVFTVGILLFSGSLYALSLSGTKGLGAVTPLGGLAFIIGWLLLAI